MASRITTTRHMEGARLTIGDFRALFDGLPDDVIPEIRKTAGDHMGPDSTSVTVNTGSTETRRAPRYTSDYVSGTGSQARDYSDPFGPREQTR